MPITHRLLAAALIAVSGALVMLAIGAPFAIVDLALVAFAAAGAFLAGLVCAKLFGQTGRDGDATAIVGAILSTLLGAAIAGLCVGFSALGVRMVIMAPIFVAGAILTSPLVFPVWVTSMWAAHLAMRRVIAAGRQCDPTP